MTIESDRALGGAGAILVTLSIISSIFNIANYALPNIPVFNSGFISSSSFLGVLSLIGFILFIIAIINFSRHYNERKISHYILYGIIAAIVTSVLVGAILSAYSLGNLVDLSSSTETPTSIIASVTRSVPLFGVVGLIFAVSTILSLNLLAAKSQVHLFSISAKMFLLGAILQIVVVTIFAVLAFSLSTINLVSASVGLVQYVAWALLAIAFFRIKPPITQMPTSTNYSSTPTISKQTKYCNYCGDANSTDMVYCVTCEKKQ